MTFPFDSGLDLVAGGAGWTQADRLLRLSTPLGADVLIAEEARIVEAIGPAADHAGCRIELLALSADAFIEADALIYQPVRLDLLTADSRTGLRPFHGIVTGFDHLDANGGFARYRLVVEPWLALLEHGTDSWIFQDQTVFDIVDELFGGWQGQGRLEPAWRWDVADRSIYPVRSLTTQHKESDLAFLHRLLAEEGLFYWFEHSGAGEGGEGLHTLVIADHNAAFADAAQPRVRFTQSGATLGEDGLDRWHEELRFDCSTLEAASWDYRSLDTRPQSAACAIDIGGRAPVLPCHDYPGLYAWEDRAQGERLVGRAREAIDARLECFEGHGSVRSTAPGTVFSLEEHPVHEHEAADARRFVVTEVRHRARNNLDERLARAVRERLGPSGDALAWAASDDGPDGAAPDFYRNRLLAVRAATAWRALAADGHGCRLHPRPTEHGVHTAIVVGPPGAPVHTDRDHRIRIQHPWQRGSRAASRLTHPCGDDNAPADDRLGSWVRVLEPVAGANWGGHFIPRPGQEVLTTYLHGDVDRPVVLGAVYNGVGAADAQHNTVAAGTSEASGNAPAFFAGRDGAHAHPAALSGLKTQQLAASRRGTGGFNQLVFDDTPHEGRIELATTEYAARLQLGHLKHQAGNARRDDRGHGAELATAAAAALRAGSGLLISADARAGAAGKHLDSREPIARTDDARALAQALAEAAARQHAALAGDPAKLPAIDGLDHAAQVLAATASEGEAPSATEATDADAFRRTLGGTGTVAAWSEPRQQWSAPGGIMVLTPADLVTVSGTHTTFTAGHDIALVTQGDQALAVAKGLAFFTAGKASDPAKPNQETGIAFHAASGAVSLQAQSGPARLAAEQHVTLASTTASAEIRASKHALLTADGAYIKLEGGNIELGAPGGVSFKASKKDWTGPKSASASAALPDPGKLLECARSLGAAAGGASAM